MIQTSKTSYAHICFTKMSLDMLNEYANSKGSNQTTSVQSDQSLCYLHHPCSDLQESDFTDTQTDLSPGYS